MVIEHKPFPIMLGYSREAKNYPAPFKSIPWSLIEAHKEQCGRNQGQTPQRLAERGGLSPDELAAVLEDRPWKRMEFDESFAAIAVILESTSCTECGGIDPNFHHTDADGQWQPCGTCGGDKKVTP